MSNRVSHYSWECLSQNTLDDFCKRDGIRKLARHKWLHISQAVRFLRMNPKQIYQEGFRDFLAVRTNPFYYGWDEAHVDGIIHPDAVMVHAGAVLEEAQKREVLKRLAHDGLPTGLDILLFSSIIANPEIFHKEVRTVADYPVKRGYLPDPNHLPKAAFNGAELRNNGLWWTDGIEEVKQLRKKKTG